MGLTTVETKTAARRVRGKREHRAGRVLSDGSDKTIKVRFEYMVKHPKYGKYYRRSTTLHAHDEENRAKTGDWVEVAACRKMSKTKCWRLLRVIGRSGKDQTEGSGGTTPTE